MARSTIKILTPAADLALLSIDQLRLAAGPTATDGSKDDQLTALGLAISDRIAAICDLRSDGIHPATLLRETIEETFWASRGHWRRSDRFVIAHEESHPMILSRRPIQMLRSLIVDGSDVDVDTNCELIIDNESGLVSREFGDWFGRKIVITYDAGFDTVPAGLVMAAQRLAKMYWASATRDDGIRRLNIPNVIDKQWWVGGITDADVPQSILDVLAPYTNGYGMA